MRKLKITTPSDLSSANESSENIQKSTDYAVYVDKKFTELKKDIDSDLEKSKRDTLRELEKDRVSVVESIGIFVALFTFISIEFQVFNSYRDPLAISGLTLILLGSISFFVSLFDLYILNKMNSIVSEKNPLNIFLILPNWKITFFIIELILILLGISIFTSTKPERFEDESDRIEQKLIETINTRLDNNIYLQDYLEKSEKNEDILECLKNKGYFTKVCFE